MLILLLHVNWCSLFTSQHTGRLLLELRAMVFLVFICHNAHYVLLVVVVVLVFTAAAAICCSCSCCSCCLMTNQQKWDHHSFFAMTLLTRRRLTPMLEKRWTVRVPVAAGEDHQTHGNSCDSCVCVYVCFILIRS